MLKTSFEQSKKFLRRHGLAAMMALAVGLVMVLPQWWLKFDLGPAYRGMVAFPADNDHFYLSRISAAYEGDYKITQAAMYGTAGQPYTSPPLGENLVAALAKTFQLTPVGMSIAGNFLFPALLALVLYFLTLAVTQSRLVALVVPLAVIFSSHLVFNPRNVLYLFTAPEQLWVNVYNRPIHPQVSSLFFYFWLFLLSSWLQNRRRWLPVLIGVIFGLLFYIYPYSWILAAVILGFLGTALLVKKDFVAAKGILLVGGIGILLSVGYWINAYQLSSHPLFEVMRKRFVIFESRAPMWSDLLVLDLVGLLIYVWKKPKDYRIILLFSVFFALILAVNQQVITGLRFFPGHWHWYYVVPLTILLWVYLGYKVLRRFRFLGPVFLVLVGTLSFADGIITQRTQYLQGKPALAAIQSHAFVYDWLNANAPAGSVVLAGGKFSERLPIYTSHFRYIYQPTDELSLISTEQLRHGFFVRLYLQGVTPESVSEYINQHTPELNELLFGYYLRYTKSCTACYDERDIQQLREQYKEFVANDFETQLKKYKVDYAVWQEGGEFLQRFEEFDFMMPAAEINGMKIYKIAN